MIGNHRRSIGIAFTLAIAGAMMGCDESSSSSGATIAPAVSAVPVASASAASATGLASTDVGDDDQGAAFVDHHRHHHGGVAMFLSMSLDSLGVPDGERADIEKIQTNLMSKEQPVHAAQQNVLSVLADGVAAGKVDTKKLDAAIAQVETASAAAESASADALNQLHTTLSPLERQALMDKLNAHWGVWKQANAEETQKPNGKNVDRLGVLTTDLALTQDQANQIKAATANAATNDKAPKLDPNDVDAHLKTLTASFESETFDVKTLNGVPFGDAHLASRGERSMASLYAAAAPILTADQRTKLAQKLRDHATQESGAPTSTTTTTAAVIK
jgi:Spy/CpxP family protein refolding chaperone